VINPAIHTTEESRSTDFLLSLVAQWERSEHTLDFLLKRGFAKADFSAAEKAKITDQAYGWARWRGTARFLLSKKLNRGLNSLPARMRRSLELAVSRVLFEERTPAAIVVNHTVANLRRHFGGTLAGVANVVLREIAALSAQPRSREATPGETAIAAFLNAGENPVAFLAASGSHPDWIVQRWFDRWGFERTREQLHWNNERPGIWLRWNRLKGDLDNAREMLASAQIQFREHAELSGFFQLLSMFQPIAADLVEQGRFSVQDPSAALAVYLLNPQPGQKILDLCAAPGGKTTLTAELTDDRAVIIAVDSSADRLQMLNQSLNRLGIQSVHIVVSDGRKFSESQKAQASFDAVLVDAPCSGFGVISRRADLRWRRNPEDIPELVTLQRELLRAGSRCVKPGGALVYSTCSIEPEENEEIVEDFLAENPHFALDSNEPPVLHSFRLRPGEIASDSPRDRIDGVYAARLIHVR
jgi:16S rRNA (cytosine967-C5)-methyltransferase